MARHREAAARAAQAAALERAPAAPQIPTLTDLVSGPQVAVATPPSAAPVVPTPPAPTLPPPPIDVETAGSPEEGDPAGIDYTLDSGPGPDHEITIDALPDDQRRALEDAVFERIRVRLDAEMSELLGRELVPELAARLDAATQALAARLREEIPAAVAQALREHAPPRGD